MPDITKQELIEQANEVLKANPRALVFVKWTCPLCGERVTANMPNQINTRGYFHEERADGSPCWGYYNGPLWGMAVVVTNV